jgi:hypothetical protein
MFTLRKLSILGLLLCSTVLVTAVPDLATPTSAAPRVSAVSASLQSNTVTITGSRFQPGSRVTLTLVGVISSRERAVFVVLARRSTLAQYATTGCPGPGMGPGCSRPNPQAGTISIRMRLARARQAANLMVFYRSAGRTGLEAVNAG